MSSTGSPERGERRSGWISSGRWIGATAVVAVILAIIAFNRPNTPYVASVAAAVPGADPGIAGTPVKVGISDCGVGWTGGVAGPETFALWNDSGFDMEIYLQSATSGKVVLDVETVGPNVTRSASVTLAAGSYEFRCTSSESSGINGPVVQVTGSYSGAVTPGLVPVTPSQLVRPIVGYMHWIASRFPTLERQVKTLDTDVRTQHLARAKTAWLAAHQTYATLGAAYGAFGDYDTAIDGDPASTTTALKDKQLTGFRKIEAQLWSGVAPRKIAPYTSRLIKDVGALAASIGTGNPQQMDPVDIGLRSHEILEDALLHTLTGDDDQGSGTSLATISANLVGTAKVIGFIAPILKAEDPSYPAEITWLAKSQHVVDGYHHSKRWTPLSRLTLSQHEHLDAVLNETVELLATNAVVTDPRPSNGVTP